MTDRGLIGGMIDEVTGANEIRRDKDGNVIENPNTNIPGMGIVNAGLTMMGIGAVMGAVDGLAAGATDGIQSVLNGGPVTTVSSAGPMFQPIVEAMGNTFTGENFDANAQPVVPPQLAPAAPVNEVPVRNAMPQNTTQFTPGTPFSRN
jgi:hypothetical protein